MIKMSTMGSTETSSRVRKFHRNRTTRGKRRLGMIEAGKRFGRMISRKGESTLPDHRSGPQHQKSCNFQILMNSGRAYKAGRE